MIMARKPKKDADVPEEESGEASAVEEKELKKKAQLFALGIGIFLCLIAMVPYFPLLGVPKDYKIGHIFAGAGLASLFTSLLSTASGKYRRFIFNGAAAICIPFWLLLFTYVRNEAPDVTEYHKYSVDLSADETFYKERRISLTLGQGCNYYWSHRPAEDILYFIVEGNCFDTIQINSDSGTPGEEGFVKIPQNFLSDPSSDPFTRLKLVIDEFSGNYKIMSASNTPHTLNPIGWKSVAYAAEDIDGPPETPPPYRIAQKTEYHQKVEDIELQTQQVATRNVAREELYGLLASDTRNYFMPVIELVVENPDSFQVIYEVTNAISNTSRQKNNRTIISDLGADLTLEQLQPFIDAMKSTNRSLRYAATETLIVLNNPLVIPSLKEYVEHPPIKYVDYNSMLVIGHYLDTVPEIEQASLKEWFCNQLIDFPELAKKGIINEVLQQKPETQKEGIEFCSEN